MRLRWSTLVGVLAAGFGLAVVAQRGLAGTLPLTYAYVVAIGAVALLQGLVFLQRWRRTDLRFTETGDPERRYRAPTPGDEVDRTLREAAAYGPRGVNARHELRERLHRTAVDALVAHENVDRETATRWLNRGTWTDDLVAAWFLGTEPELPLRVRLRSVLGRTSRFTLGVRRSVEALARLQAATTSTSRRTDDQPEGGHSGPDRDPDDPAAGSAQTDDAARRRDDRPTGERSPPASPATDRTQGADP